MTNKSYYDDFTRASELVASAEFFATIDEKVMELCETLSKAVSTYSKELYSNSVSNLECSLSNVTSAYLALEYSLARHSRDCSINTMLRTRVRYVYNKLLDESTLMLKSSVIVDHDLLPRGSISTIMSLYKDSKTIGFSLSANESMTLHSVEEFIANIM